MYFASVHEIDRRIADHPVAIPDAVACLDRRPEITGHRDRPDMDAPVLDHGYMQAVPVEDDRLRRNDERRRLAGICKSTVQ